MPASQRKLPHRFHTTARLRKLLLVTRVPYAAAMTDGHTAIEITPKGPAASETACLWRNILAWFHASMNTSQHANMAHPRKVSASG